MPKPQSKCLSPPGLPKGREELVASLRALLANDDVDLEILRSGAPWPSATEIAQLSQVSGSSEDSPAAISCSPNETVVVDPALGGDSCYASIDLEPNWLGNLMAYSCDELVEQPDSLLVCSASESISTSNSSNNGNSTDYLSHFSSSSISQWDALLDSVCPQTPHNRAIVQSPQRQNQGSEVPQPSKASLHRLGEGGPATTTSLAVGQAGAIDRDRSASNIASCHASPRKRQRPHYAIEKRYRAGLQERFEALRDCVTSLKQTQHGQRLPGNNEDLTEGDDGASDNDRDRVVRMNKAEVLNQATVYIQQLQEENEVAIEHIKLLIGQFRVMKRAMRQALGAGLGS
ncbi:uncharacterized protein FSUBG_14116 [Fusarium subglutinans]|uniref:BHLH domain-containing protein n=1 Tax=Gibberella subglutinans TaxID=42677 RepID=A0A8H5KJP8_GIBSU|nr:uncharacterized protein FSUBG_14116 [Fusarium subglutinans]KAF5573200.1 hypothetical protein FSUBG_14116 [Fusarium subglutinans]